MKRIPQSTMSAVQPIRPAATVIIVREAAPGFEIFMLRRTATEFLSTCGNVTPCAALSGSFVFPALVAAQERSTAAALRTTRTVFVRFHPEVENSFTRKQIVVGHLEFLEPEKIAQ